MLKVDKSKCNGDGICVSVCPVGGPRIKADGKAEIDVSVCMECHACMNICPQEAISEEYDYDVRRDKNNVEHAP